MTLGSNITGRRRRAWLIISCRQIIIILVIAGLVANILNFFFFKRPQTWSDHDMNPKDSYTLVINTYNKDVELIKHLDHWLSCSRIFQVQVVWNDPDRDPPQSLLDMEKEYEHTLPDTFRPINIKRLSIRRQETSKLSNRFSLPPGGFETEGVFNVDDDVVIDCGLLYAGYEQWKEKGQDSMIGFEPRKIELGNYKYRWDDACVGECVYNLIFATKGAFLHRKYYALYNSDAFRTLRKVVDKGRTGADLLMSYVFYSEYFLKNQKEPTLVSIQADESYDENIHEGTDRFSLLEKVYYVAEFISNKINKPELSESALDSPKRTDVMKSIEEYANIHSPSIILPPNCGKWYIVDNHGGRYVEKPCSNGIHLRCGHHTVSSASVILWMAVTVLKDILLFTVLVILGFFLYIYKVMPGNQSRFDVYGRYSRVEMQADVNRSTLPVSETASTKRQ